MRRLFRGGLLFDGVKAHPAHALLIEGERIVDTGPQERFAGFTGPTLDLAGATLMPGLIDCHVHLCFGAEPDVVALVSQLRPVDYALRALQHAQTALRGGITTVRDLGGCDYAEIAVRDSIRTGRHEGPTILCAGKMICITGGHGWFVGIEADGADGCIRAVRTNVKAGADWIKFMASGGVMTQGVDPLATHQRVIESEEVVREAQRLGRRTACHATGAGAILQAVKAGVTSVEHGFEIDDEIIEAMLERGTVLVPTLSAMGCVHAEHMARLPPYVGERVGKFRVMQRESLMRFYRAGGRIAMGTDAGTPLNQHGANAQELGLMVDTGISTLDALKAATSGAADLLDLKDRGRLTSGSFADLLIVSGDPTSDIRAVSETRNHRTVLRNGRLVSHADNDAGRAIQRTFSP